MKKPYTKCPKCNSEKLTISIVGQKNGVVLVTWDYYCIDCGHYWNAEELSNAN